MFSAFSVTSFAENDNTYSCDFTSLVKNNADTTYGTADDIYDIDDYTKAFLTYAIMEVMYHLPHPQTVVRYLPAVR